MPRPDNGLARGHPRTHAAHVRHHRPGLPDRQDPGRHVAVVPGSVRLVLSVPQRADRPPSDIARRHLRAYERVTRYYVGQLAYLAGRLAAMPEGDATVLDNSCLMFVSNMWSRKPARFGQGAAAAGGRTGRCAANGPGAGLSETRRRQPQAVQPVSVADESHGREGGTIWRQSNAAGRFVIAHPPFETRPLIPKCAKITFIRALTVWRAGGVILLISARHPGGLRPRSPFCLVLLG